MQEQETLFLGDDYGQVRYINEGGMGTLFRAHKIGLDVEVVVKRVKHQYREKVNQQAEADILKRLKHKFLPRIYDVISQPNGDVCMVMDYIEGVNLKEYVVQHGAQSQAQTLKWATQICEVCAYLHSQTPAIIHCDLKPSNIMITPAGDVCIIDFNTSLVMRGGTFSIGATPGYAAPEQYRPVDIEKAFAPTPYMNVVERTRSTLLAETFQAGGFQGVTKRTDIYSIGAVMYFTLTGYHPARSLDEVTPITQYDIVLGQAMQDVILCAMEKEPAKRFVDAKQMEQALLHLQARDHGFQRLQLLRKISGAVAALLIIGGCALACCGVFVMDTESSAHYITLVETGIQQAQASQYADSYETLQTAAGMYPGRIEAYNGLAILLYQQGDYTTCITLLEEVLDTQSLTANTDVYSVEYANIEYILASCYKEQSDYFSAISHYENAILYAQQTVYYRDLAIAQANTGALDDAAQTLSYLEKAGADARDLTLIEGEIELANGNYQAAIALFQQVYALDGDEDVTARAYTMAARAYQKLGTDFLDDEIAVLKQACNQFTVLAQPSLYQLLAEAYTRKASATPEESTAYYQDALQCYQQLKSCGYQSDTIYQNIALLLQTLGDYEGAELVLLEQQALEPESYRVYMRLAFLYAVVEGEKDNSARDYAQVLEVATLAQFYYQSYGDGTDQEMSMLEDMLQQLYSGNWL